MKRLFILFAIAGLLVVSCNNDKGKTSPATVKPEKDDYSTKDKPAEDRSSDNKWAASDIRSFDNDCHREMKGNVEDELLDRFCSCFLEKFQANFSSYAEFNKNSTHEDGVKVGRECRLQLTDGKSGNETLGDTWSAKDVRDYVDNCVPGAMENGLSREKATQYCTCMQQKLEKNYPDPKDLIKMSEKEIMDISTKLAGDCLRGQ